MVSQLIPFRRDNGSIVWLSYARMMSDMDACGFVTLPDGEVARRARDLEPKPERKLKPVVACQTTVVSDSLGFVVDSLEDQKAHLKKTGIKGIEFKEDPDVPNFYQVHCSTESAKLKYAKSRGMRDQNSRNGAGSLGEVDLRNAKELVSRRFASQTEASQ